ncbi:zinc-dependent alcohol dehydrogenase [Nitriliruptor alkaliphilus]|uniref:zinc-dependent alcohol dehydrogenase n=1 Tax=Nitriliruptor alkaliphilus TaxID=427918 RepID=UPI000696E958|nr:alcohol dehydrogenase catalytic domain-containing protein [Nitriliruptor alkaliphilus]
MDTLSLEFHRSLPRYVATRALSRRAPGTISAGLAPLRLVSGPAPEPRGVGWSRVRPRLSGICGSDLSMLSGRTSPYFSPLVSFPLTPGHEVVGELVDDVDDLAAGTRVVIDPVLACAPRGLAPCEECRAGRTSRCAHVTVGHLQPGLQTGYCGSVGGGWSHQLIAHRSQLHVVPDEVSDARAVLVEPLACAIHAALRAEVTPDDQVLVVGSGAVGLLTVLALRAVTEVGRILVTAKHPRQAGLAKDLGATTVVSPDAALGTVRQRTRALRLHPDLGADFLLGGVDIAIDCAGSRSSADLALRATRAGGRVVLSGMPPAGVDLSPAWFRELTVVGAYASGREEAAGGVAAFDLALDLTRAAPLDDLAPATYPLPRWRQAIDHALDAGRLGTPKVAFDLTATS